MNNPKVSIVIPVYNREQFINDAIKSALRQTYSNVEIVVVDNKSTDNTWGVLQEWAQKDNRIRIYQNEENIGPVRNWIKCFEYSTGEYVKIIWSDDWISDDYLEKTIPLFDESVAFVLTRIIQIDDDTKRIERDITYKKELYTSEEYLKDILTYNNNTFTFSPGAGVFRRKDLLSGIVMDIPNNDGLQPLRNGAGIDLMLFLNTANKYTVVKTSNSAISYFRDHSQSFSHIDNSGVILTYWWAKFTFIKDNGLKLESLLKAILFLNKVQGRKYVKSVYRQIKPTILFYIYVVVVFVNKIGSWITRIFRK